MQAKTRIAAALAFALAFTALTGAAFAGKPDDPGKSGQAPGQVKKAEPAPEPAARAPAAEARSESKGKSASAPGKTKTGKAATPSKGKSAQAKARQEAKAQAGVQQQGDRGRSAEARRHVIVCHRTGSDTNPYVVINIPMTAWNEAHKPGGHPTLGGRDDFILKDPASRPGSKDGFTKADCVARGEAAVQLAQVTQEGEGQVLGVRAKIAPKAKPRGGVLGALGAVGEAELPFTGLPLWIAALIGLALVSAGLGARRAMR